MGKKRARPARPTKAQLDKWASPDGIVPGPPAEDADEILAKLEKQDLAAAKKARDKRNRR